MSWKSSKKRCVLSFLYCTQVYIDSVGFMSDAVSSRVNDDREEMRCLLERMNENSSTCILTSRSNKTTQQWHAKISLQQMVYYATRLVSTNEEGKECRVNGRVK